MENVSIKAILYKSVALAGANVFSSGSLGI